MWLNFSINIKSPTSEYELSKIPHFKFSPKNTLIFFLFSELFFQLSFPNTRNSILKHFSPSSHFEFFFRTLRFFFQKKLRFFLRHYTDTWHFFSRLQEKLNECSSANNRQVPVKYRMYLTPQLFKTNRTYSKQYNRIHRYKTNKHTHTYLVWSKEIWAANSEFNRVSRENSA